MANEFIIKNGFRSQGNSEVTGSLNVTAGITGSLLGTSSWAQNALTASTVLVGSVGLTAGYYYLPLVSSHNANLEPSELRTDNSIIYDPFYNLLFLTGSIAVTGSINVTGSSTISADPNNGVSYLSVYAGHSEAIGIDPYTNEIIIDSANNTLYRNPPNGVPVRADRLSIDWNNSYLYGKGTGLLGTGQQVSLDWNLRELIGTNGTASLDWSNGIRITGSLLISGSVTGSSGNDVTSDALLQATLLYLSNNF